MAGKYLRDLLLYLMAAIVCYVCIEFKFVAGLEAIVLLVFGYFLILTVANLGLFLSKIIGGGKNARKN